MTSTATVVQDQSTNNLHLRGEDKADGTATALCNKRYRVYTYTGESQDRLFQQYTSWNTCDRCEAKAAKVAKA